MRRSLLCVAVTLLTACTSASSASSGQPESSAGGTSGATSPTAVDPNGSIVRVVDGDTVIVRFDDGGKDERVRLIGIDTPETVKPNSPVECFGLEASSFTKQLLEEGTPVLVVRDVEARDDYGRLLGYVYRSGDGMFVNLEIVAQGYATLLTYPPNIAHVDEFKAAASAARAADLGLWQACNG